MATSVAFAARVVAQLNADETALRRGSWAQLARQGTLGEIKVVLQNARFKVAELHRRKFKHHPKPKPPVAWDGTPFAETAFRLLGPPTEGQTREALLVEYVEAAKSWRSYAAVINKFGANPPITDDLLKKARPRYTGALNIFLAAHPELAEPPFEGGCVFEHKGFFESFVDYFEGMHGDVPKARFTEILKTQEDMGLRQAAEEPALADAEDVDSDVDSDVDDARESAEMRSADAPVALAQKVDAPPQSVRLAERESAAAAGEEQLLRLKKERAEFAELQKSFLAREKASWEKMEREMAVREAATAREAERKVAAHKQELDVARQRLEKERAGLEAERKTREDAESERRGEMQRGHALELEAVKRAAADEAERAAEEAREGEAAARRKLEREAAAAREAERRTAADELAVVQGRLTESLAERDKIVEAKVGAALAAFEQQPREQMECAAAMREDAAREAAVREARENAEREAEARAAVAQQQIARLEKERAELEAERKTREDAESERRGEMQRGHALELEEVKRAAADEAERAAEEAREAAAWKTEARKAEAREKAAARKAEGELALVRERLKQECAKREEVEAKASAALAEIAEAKREKQLCEAAAREATVTDAAGKKAIERMDEHHLVLQDGSVEAIHYFNKSDAGRGRFGSVLDVRVGNRSEARFRSHASPDLFATLSRVISSGNRAQDSTRRSRGKHCES